MVSIQTYRIRDCFIMINFDLTTDVPRNQSSISQTKELLCAPGLLHAYIRMLEHIFKRGGALGVDEFTSLHGSKCSNGGKESK